MFNKKFLPIGTICKINKVDSLVMIIGYFMYKYDDKIEKYDYSVCLYPEGLYMSSNLFGINHDEIMEIVKIGYINSSFESLNSELHKYEMSMPVKSAENKIDILFDENGVVIGVGSEKLDMSNVSTTKPNLKFNSNGVVLDDGNNVKQEVKPKTNLKFDSNGVVLDDGKNVKQEAEPKTNLKFDSSGVVLDDGKNAKQETEPKTNLKFDSNGVVLDDGKNAKQEIEPKTSLKFDSNGFVVSEN